MKALPRMRIERVLILSIGFFYSITEDPEKTCRTGAGERKRTERKETKRHSSIPTTCEEELFHISLFRIQEIIGSTNFFSVQEQRKRKTIQTRRGLPNLINLH